MNTGTHHEESPTFYIVTLTINDCVIMKMQTDSGREIPDWKTFIIVFQLCKILCEGICTYIYNNVKVGSNLMSDACVLILKF